MDKTTTRPLELISLVLPVYNEEEVLPLLMPRLRELLERLPCKAEVIFVNDGSKDRTAEILAREASDDLRIKVLDFSRNFGHQVAITAGTDFAQGDVVVIMDADLQDPPEVIDQMVEKYREGFDVVYGQRTERHGETVLKRLTAWGFYWLMRKMVHRDLPENTGDFRLMSRAAVHALRQMREQHRFVRGMVTWVGFRQTAVRFERPARAAGQTKYPMHKMLAFAWRAITSFSGLPLRLAMGTGVLLVMAALGYTVYALFQALVMHETVAGWTSLVCLQTGLSGVMLLFMGLIGDYIARIYEEIKGRPLYIIQDAINFEAGDLVEVPPRTSLSLRPRLEPRVSVTDRSARAVNGIEADSLPSVPAK